jgi:hypothetical protein
VSRTRSQTFNGEFTLKGVRYDLVFKFFPETGGGDGYYRDMTSPAQQNLFYVGPHSSVKTQQQATAWMRQEVARLLGCKTQDVKISGSFRSTS